ncbi:chemotaxis protein CheW [bacterium]|nr:chemotaxis protein CheW [bacterium]
MVEKKNKKTKKTSDTGSETIHTNSPVMNGSTSEPQLKVQNILNNLRQEDYTSSTNCWEAVRCGQEHTCDVPKNTHGRQCYLYDHTFCFGEDMGPFHIKIKTCVDMCPFYKSLIPEIGAMWVEAHRQIAQLTNDQMTPEIEAHILKQRADQLSEALAEEDTGEKIEVLLFQLGQELFAMEAQYIQEIRSISEVTPVPCTPDFVLGITTIRGHIYSVLDIRRSLGVEDRSVTQDSMYILTSHRDLDVCLLADSVIQKQTIARRDVKTSVGGAQHASNAYTTGFFFFNNKIVSLINWDHYLSQTNIVVNEEV